MIAAGWRRSEVTAGTRLGEAAPLFARAELPEPAEVDAQD
jgi:hypothetical protein